MDGSICVIARYLASGGDVSLWRVWGWGRVGIGAGRSVVSIVTDAFKRHLLSLDAQSIVKYCCSFRGQREVGVEIYCPQSAVKGSFGNEKSTKTYISSTEAAFNSIGITSCSW